MTRLTDKGSTFSSIARDLLGSEKMIASAVRFNVSMIVCLNLWPIILVLMK